MAAPVQPPWTPAPPNRMGPGRIVALVFGIVLLLPAAGLLLAGGALLWADTGNRSDGYLFSETDSFATDGYALVSERIDLATGADWLPISSALGTARAEVTSTDPDADVFVGIAPLAQGAAYLSDVERAVIDDLGTTSIDEVPVPGGEPSGPPGDEDFWVAQVSGSGTQQLDWEPAEGNWLFVVMNEDGSSGISVDARIGAEVPALGGLAWALLGVGLLFLVVGLLLVVLALRRRPAAAGYREPAGPPWTPPAPTDRTTAVDGAPDSESSKPRRPPAG
jgi:hypothetical protein